MSLRILCKAAWVVCEWYKQWTIPAGESMNVVPRSIHRQGTWETEGGQEEDTTKMKKGIKRTSMNSRKTGVGGE